MPCQKWQEVDVMLLSRFDALNIWAWPPCTCARNVQWCCRELLQRRRYPFLRRRALHAASRSQAVPPAASAPAQPENAHAWQALHALHAVYEVQPLHFLHSRLLLHRRPLDTYFARDVSCIAFFWRLH
jgi:hypothetical protein